MYVYIYSMYSMCFYSGLCEHSCHLGPAICEKSKVRMQTACIYIHVLTSCVVVIICTCTELYAVHVMVQCMHSSLAVLY